MRLLPVLISRPGRPVFLLAAFAITCLLAGCGGHAKRPASSLSEHETAVLGDYEKVRAALASDDTRAARKWAGTLLTELKKSNASPSSSALVAQADTLANARTIDTMREDFKPVSESLLPLAAGVDGYYILTSPPGFKGDWIQRTPEVDNPYFGAAMHSSGSLQK